MRALANRDKALSFIYDLYSTSVIRIKSLNANTCNASIEGGRISRGNFSDDDVCIILQSDGTATIRTRKFLTNRLLQRKQMVIYICSRSSCYHVERISNAVLTDSQN